MLKAQGKKHEVVQSAAWTSPMDLVAAEKAIASGNYQHVLAVHHETTTGRLNDLAALGALCKKHNVALLVDALHQELQLAEFARRLLVDLDDLADFGDGETDAPAAEDFPDEAPVGLPEQTGAPAPLWMDQSLVLVEAERARRDPEFARQFRYAIVFVHRHVFPVVGQTIILTFT
jgi:hypothetical protein